MCNLSERCPHNEQKGQTHELIQTTVAYNLALRVPHCVGAKIPLSGSAREDQRGGGVMRSGPKPANGVRGGGVERAERSRARGGTGAAKVVHIRIHGAVE